MKEFNLSEAKAGKSVQTKSGLPVRIICFDAKDELPILALITIEDREVLHYYDSDGITRYNSFYCLAMKPEQKTGWINIYKHNKIDRYYGQQIHNTKESADLLSEDRIDCIEITFNI